VEAVTYASATAHATDDRLSARYRDARDHRYIEGQRLRSQGECGTVKYGAVDPHLPSGDKDRSFSIMNGQLVPWRLMHRVTQKKWMFFV